MDDREVTKTLRRMANLITEHTNLQSKIYDYCEEKYGTTPSDIDNDDYLDLCVGGGGACNGMTAEEFHESMIRSMEVMGMDTDDL